MLVLTGKIGDQFLIEGVGKITLVKQTGTRIKVGFEFPRELLILREKLIDAEADTEETAKTTPDVARGATASRLSKLFGNAFPI